MSSGNCFDIQIQVDTYEVTNTRRQLPPYGDDARQEFEWRWFAKSKTNCVLPGGRSMVETMVISEPNPTINPPSGEADEDSSSARTVNFLLSGSVSWLGDGEDGRWNLHYRVFGRAAHASGTPTYAIYDGTFKLWGCFNALNILVERYGTASDCVATKVNLFAGNGMQCGTFRAGRTTFEMLRARNVPAQYLHFSPAQHFMRNLEHRNPAIRSAANSATTF